jgi:adenylate cyclase
MSMQDNARNGEATTAPLELHLFGAPQITLDGVPVTGLTSGKAQAILFYLALTGRGHTRSALAGLLWGDMPGKAARGNLRKALHQLRKYLGAYLVIERDFVALAEDADYWVDALAFNALLTEAPAADARGRMQRAVDLYRGDFLEGFYVQQAPDFENWWLIEQARLRGMMLAALETLADLDARQDDLDGAITRTRRFLDLEPWHEAAHRRLMTWLALAGHRTAALAQYEICRRVLAEELAVEPAPETAALYDRIREGDLKPPKTSGMHPLDIEPRPPAFLDRDAEVPESPRDPFVGREPQLRRLTALLETALTAQGQAAFVSGEAGWGKTRLLVEFSRYAQERHPDLVVASGICTTFTESGDPYLPFREILRMLCADVEQEWAVGRVTRPHALRLWHLLPQMTEALLNEGRHLIDTFIPGQALLQRSAAHESLDLDLLKRLQGLIARRRARHRDAGVDQERIFEEISHVLQTVSRDQPLLLILDDLHWADISSLGLLFHLGRRLAESHILILGAYRPEDISLGREGQEHPLVNILAEFKRLFGDVWVNLGQHGGEGRDFVDALLDSEPNRLSEDFRAKLARYTRGHPLFTVEILRDMRDHRYVYQDESGRWVDRPTITWDTLPRRVEGVIERRVDRLDARLRTTLAVASTEGEEFIAEVLAQVRKMDEGDMVSLLSRDLARKHRLVQASGVRQFGERRISRYRFSHNLFQKYLYQTLDPVERAYLHEAIGNALETVFQGHTSEISVQLARHFQEAGQVAKTVEYLRQAGDAAADVYANTEAIAHYRQAIDLACQIAIDAEELTLLHLRMGRVLELDSQFDRGLRNYEGMEKLAHQRADRRMELASLIARATIQSVPTAVHDPERARDLGRRALALARELGDRAAEAKILWNLSLANYFTNRLPQAIDCGERSLALARELGLREQTAHTLNDLGGFIYLYSGRIDQARTTLQEATELWHSLGNMAMFVDSLSGSCIAHVYAGEYKRAIALSEQAFEISRSIDNVWGQSYSRWTIGDALRARGEYSRAIEASEECIRLGELAGFLASQTYTRSKLAVIYGDLGALEHGIALTEVSLEVAEKHLQAHSMLALGVLAHLHVLKGDLAQAEMDIGEARRGAFPESWGVFYLGVLVAEAELALQQEDYERAVAATDELLDRVRRHGMRSQLPEALYLQGKALLGLSQEKAAHERFMEARGEAEEMGSRRILWRILHALAQLETEPSRAQEFRRQARQVLKYIADHINRPDLQRSFLGQPDVQAVIADR